MDYAIENAQKEGRKEGIFEVAKELKKNGASTDLLKKSSELTKEQIENL